MIKSITEVPGFYRTEGAGEHLYQVEHKTDWHKYMSIWAKDATQAKKRMTVRYPENKPSDFKAKRA